MLMSEDKSSSRVIGKPYFKRFPMKLLQKVKNLSAMLLKKWTKQHFKNFWSKILKKVMMKEKNSEPILKVIFTTLLLLD